MRFVEIISAFAVGLSSVAIYWLWKTEYNKKEQHHFSNLKKNQDNKQVPYYTERTLVVIKPDGLQRAKIGETIKTLEKKGYHIIGMKLLHATREQAKKHFAEHEDKHFFQSLVTFMTQSPIIVIALQGFGVIEGIRRIVGDMPRPLNCVEGTIRDGGAVTVARNLIHASDSVHAGRREISVWFNSNELVEPLSTDSWKNEPTKGGTPKEREDLL